MNDLRYPIGPFALEGDITPIALNGFVDSVAGAPAEFRMAVRGLSDAQLDTPYRDGGWTVRQVVHHIADSNINGYIRFKLALTEDYPVIAPFAEGRWAELDDAKHGVVEASLRVMESLHARWAICMRALSPAHWKRAFRHPEQGIVPLDRATAMYAWHCNHHLAHITRLRERKGW